jgi:hypothetical protein
MAQLVFGAVRDMVPQDAATMHRLLIDADDAITSLF